MPMRASDAGSACGHAGTECSPRGNNRQSQIPTRKDGEFPSVRHRRTDPDSCGRNPGMSKTVFGNPVGEFGEVGNRQLFGTHGKETVLGTAEVAERRLK